MKEFMKKYKYVVVGVSVLAIVLGGTFLYSTRAEAKDEKAVEDVTQQVNEIADNVDVLFTDDTYALLADDATMEQVLQNEKDITKLEGNESFTEKSATKLNTAISENEYAKQMIELRDMVKALFDENGTLITGSDVDSVVAKANEISTFKPEYVSSIMPIINEALAQAGGAVPTPIDAVMAQVDEAETQVVTKAQGDEGDVASADNSGSTPPQADNGGSTPPPSSGSTPPSVETTPPVETPPPPVEETPPPKPSNPLDTNGDGIVTEINVYYTLGHEPTAHLTFDTKKEMDDYMWENYPEHCGWYGNYHWGMDTHYE